LLAISGSPKWANLRFKSFRSFSDGIMIPERLVVAYRYAGPNLKPG
jgi:hypothetical protein